MKADPQNLIASLSGKVSTEALTAFQALITKHKTEMETMRTNSGNTIDKTQMEAKRVAFKAEIDALIVKYPELRTAMPTMEKWGIMNRGNGEIKTIIETLPTTTQAQLKAIHDEYKIKQDTLKNEEKAKIDAILAGYPEIKAKLDTMEKNHWQGMEGRGFHGKMNNKARDNNNKK